MELDKPFPSCHNLGFSRRESDIPRQKVYQSTPKLISRNRHRPQLLIGSIIPDFPAICRNPIFRQPSPPQPLQSTPRPGEATTLRVLEHPRGIIPLNRGPRIRPGQRVSFLNITMAGAAPAVLPPPSQVQLSCQDAGPNPAPAIGPTTSPVPANPPGSAQEIVDSSTVYKRFFGSTHSQLFILQTPRGQYLVKQIFSGSWQNEFQILRGLHHPYVEQIFGEVRFLGKPGILLEYIDGGLDLLGLLNSSSDILISRGCPFTLFQRKMLFAQLLLAVKFLHDHNVIHRDLKLENVLITKDGKVKLIDFDLSKKLASSEQLASTPCGSPVTAAPELIRNERYNRAVDLWALGVILYSILTNSELFYRGDLPELYSRILNSSPRDYERISDPAARDLITRFLDHNPNNRIGMKSFEEIKHHPFFQGINWEALERGAISAISPGQVRVLLEEKQLKMANAFAGF